MLPHILQKLSFPKLSWIPPFKFTGRDKHKISKFFRPLSISPSAAVRKPKRVTINKVSPFRKLYSKRPNAYITKLEKHCWESSLTTKALVQPPAVTSTSIQVQAEFRKHQKPSRNLNFLEKLKTVVTAGIRKKTEKKTTKQQHKRKLKKRLQALPSLGMSNSTSTTYNILPNTAATILQCTPSKSDAPISPPVFVSKNGKVKGLDSVYANPDFDASLIKAYTIDDPAKYKESIEAHLEMKMEIARASDPEMFDDPSRDRWSPETFAGKFILEVSLHRQKVAHEHALTQERKHEQMQIDHVDTVAPSIASQLLSPFAFAHPPLLPQPRQEDEPMLDVYRAMFNSSSNFSAPFSRTATAHITQRNTRMPHDFSIYPLARPQLSQTMPETAAKKLLAPPPGAHKVMPINFTTYPLSISGSPQDFYSRPGITAVAAKKALAPPPGARRAVPMNLVTFG